MRKQKLISGTLVLAMAGSMCTTGVLAEELTVNTITTGESVLDDVTVVFNREVGDELLTKENFAVTSEGNVPEYTIEKDGNNVTLNFAKELDYDTEYTVSLKNVAEESSTFTTEENPMTLLFKEDFSSADSLNRFTNTGDQSKNFRIEGRALCVDASYAWTVGYGAIASIKGSESWRDYELSAEYKTREYSSPIVAYRQVGVDTSKAENQTQYGYFVSGGTYAAPENNPNHLYVGWQNVGTGGGDGIFSQAYTYASLEKNYGLRITATENKHTAENYDIATGVTLNSVEREIADYDYGAIGFGVYYDFTYYDNIKVIDKGFNFDVAQKKNVKNSIVLNFNEPVEPEFVTKDKFMVSNGDSVVDIDVAMLDEDSVEIKLNNAEPETVYDVTVAKSLRSSDLRKMNNDKTFKIKTGADENIKISGVSPADKATDVDTLSDVRIKFTSEPTAESLQGKITVTSEANVPEFEVVADGKDAVVKFAKELDYDTTYNVTVASGIENNLGNSLETGAAYSFTTEENPMLILFEEDFSSADSLNRFANTGDQSKNLRIEGGALCVDASYAWTVGYGAVASIKGSESWRDYELSAEYKTRRYSSPIVAYRQVGVDTSKAENQTKYGYFVSGGTYAAPEDNPSHLYIGWQNVGTGGGDGIFSQAYTNASLEKNYGMRITAIGNKHKAENYDLATGEVLNSIEREIADYDCGAIGFGVYYDFTYYDNIKVVDKGFMFETSNKKNDGTVILTFNEDVAPDTIAGNIIVSDGENTVASTATALDTNKVMVKLANPTDGARYTVTVKKEVAKAGSSYGMNNDKSFDILIDSSKVIEDYIVTLRNATVADGKITVSYNVENNKVSGKIDLVFASYDKDGKLLAAKIENVDAACGESKQGEITIPEGVKNVCMVWNGFEEMKPLDRPIPIEF